ncbi:MAG: hypothetical protein ACXWUN_02025 [Allosphingosinicella sp.]
MLKLLSRWFGRQRVSPARVSKLDPAIYRELRILLTPQIERLGVALGYVPAEGGYVSKRSRGYLYGMTAGLLGRLGRMQEPEVIRDAMWAAFRMVYGPKIGPGALERTMQECLARDGETLAGSWRGEADVLDVHAGKAGAAVMGFWLLNNGRNDPVELMPTIANPGPIAATRTR